jgi:hypothetical protein
MDTQRHLLVGARIRADCWFFLSRTLYLQSWPTIIPPNPRRGLYSVFLNRSRQAWRAMGNAKWDPIGVRAEGQSPETISLGRRSHSETVPGHR